jgi:hypothetical protein
MYLVYASLNLHILISLGLWSSSLYASLSLCGC